MSRAKRSPIAIVKRRGICLEVVNDGETLATVEIDSDSDVQVNADSAITIESAKALAAAILQACEEYEREVKP